MEQSKLYQSKLFAMLCPRCEKGNHEYCWKREGKMGCGCKCPNGEWGK